MIRTKVDPTDLLWYFRKFWALVDKNGPLPENRPELGPCWLWTGTITGTGYGKFHMQDQGKMRQLPAHRLTYQALRGPIPEGLDLDHLCRVRKCVNPWHAEAVSRRINVLRGVGLTAQNAAKTHCPQGHAYTDGNIYRIAGNGRRCKLCQKARAVRSRGRANEVRRLRYQSDHEYRERVSEGKRRGYAARKTALRVGN
jgi:hypothetical protein